jgi:hypothetical protein
LGNKIGGRGRSGSLIFSLDQLYRETAFRGGLFVRWALELTPITNIKLNMRPSLPLLDGALLISHHASNKSAEFAIRVQGRLR